MRFRRQSMAASILKRRYTSPTRLPDGHGAPAEDFPAEFDEVRSYEIRQKLRPVKSRSLPRRRKPPKQKEGLQGAQSKTPYPHPGPKPACLNPVADYLPISKIENGIIYTKDHRYVKVVEVVPINFMLRSAQEQRNIIYSFVSYLENQPHQAANQRY